MSAGNPLADAVEGVIRALIGAPGQIDEAQRERLLAGLDEAKRVLTAIGPNAPTIRAAVERRLAEIERTERGDEPTREIPPDLSLGPRPR